MKKLLQRWLGIEEIELRLDQNYTIDRAESRYLAELTERIERLEQKHIVDDGNGV